MSSSSKLEEPLKIEMLDIEKVHPNNWNPNLIPARKLAALKNYVDKTGFVQPILVRPDKNGGYEITDGEHRWHVMKELGAVRIPSIVLKEGDVDSKLRTVAMNPLRGQFIPVKLANVVHDLNKTMTAREIERLTGFNQPEIQDLMRLQKIPQDLINNLEEKLRKEERKAPLLIYFMLPHMKALKVNKTVDAWLKVHPDSNRGDWLWNTARRATAKKAVKIKHKR
jgi:ParB/RepB/Spo0J family partition protein